MYNTPSVPSIKLLLFEVNLIAPNDSIVLGYSGPWLTPKFEVQPAGPAWTTSFNWISKL